jgi:hypothetical protein
MRREWAKLRIDSARIPGRLYRDPCSQLGARLEVEHVPPEALEVVRRWVPVGIGLERYRPPFLYHATPAGNLESILTRGLLSGRLAGVSTTGREDGAQLIHVATNEDTLVTHLGTMLGKAGRDGREWALLRINAAQVRGRVFRDPASHSGCFLETECVPAEALEVLRRWAPRVETVAQEK